MIKDFDSFIKVSTISSFKKGDKIVLNMPKVEQIRDLIKNHKMHPFQGLNFDFGKPGGDIFKFKDGPATVVSVIKSKDELRFKFEGSDDTYQDSYWFFNKVKQVKKL